MGPEDMWRGSDEDVDQLTRRLDFVFEVK